MDRVADGRAAGPWPPLALGGAGLAVGIAAAALDARALGLLAGALAVAAGLTTRWAPPRDPAAGRGGDAGGSGRDDGETGRAAPVPPPGSVVATAAVAPLPPAAGLAPAGVAPAGVGPADFTLGDRPSALVDTETGLFNEDFFAVAVETRVLAARRHLRPVSVVLFGVSELDDADRTVATDPVSVAVAIRETLREADTACRLRDGRYAFVLEDTPEDGAIWTVERLRRTLSTMNAAQTRWAGIACYPAHAFSAPEVLTKAEGAYRAAKEWAQDRIEVAAADA